MAFNVCFPRRIFSKLNMCVRHFQTCKWLMCRLRLCKQMKPRRSRTVPDLPEQAASQPVGRQPAQTSGVRKRLPFSVCKA